jgi:hypothetical protein
VQLLSATQAKKFGAQRRICAVICGGKLENLWRETAIEVFFYLGRKSGRFPKHSKNQSRIMRARAAPKRSPAQPQP